MRQNPFLDTPGVDRNALSAIPLRERNLPDSPLSLLRQLARLYADECALSFLPDPEQPARVERYTYAELLSHIDCTAALFSELGQQPGGVVSTLLPNLPEMHFAVWGAQVLGAVNPVNPMLEREHIAGILDAAGTRILMTTGPQQDPELWRKVEYLAANVPGLHQVLVVDQSASSGALPSLGGGRVGVHSFNARLEEASPCPPRSRAVDPVATAALFHTGGTTGRPKLARHSHSQQVACAFQIASCLAGETTPVGLCGLPLFHVNAVFITGLSLWLQGGSVLLAGAAGYRNPALLDNFWDIVERHRVTTFSCVPTILNELSRRPIEGRDIASLEYAVCGAAPLSREMADQFERTTGLVLIEGYGQTEGTCASTLNPRYGERRIGSVGLPLPYSGLRVVELDEQKRVLRDCEPEEEGSVLISGPNVFDGYVCAEDNRDIWAEPGWLITGDLGRLDAEGYLWLTGRSKDLIIRGGHNIDPKMIEEVYYRHPDVAEVAALGRPDARLGEVPVVCIQLKPGRQVGEAELLAFGREHIGERAAAPRSVYILYKLPVTAIGKIFKPELRRMVIEELVRGEIRSALAEELPVTVAADKRHGFLVTVIARPDLQPLLRELFGAYTFALEFLEEPASRVATT